MKNLAQNQKRPHNNLEDLFCRFNNCKKRKTNIEDYETVINKKFIDSTEMHFEKIGNSKNSLNTSNISNAMLNKEIISDFEEIMAELEKIKN